MKQPIKILVDAHVFDHSFQGTATYIEGLYKALVNNDEVEIYLCANNIERLQNIFTDSRFKFIQLKYASKFVRLAYELPLIIRENKIDFSHFQYITPLFKKGKFINTIHDLLFLDYPEYFPWTYRVSKKFLFKNSAKNTDVLLTVSEFSKKEIVRHFNIDASKIFVTPNAVKNPSNISDENSFANPYLLSVGRFEPRKNQISLLEAYLNLKLYEKGYHLIFIGGKKEQIELDYYNDLIKQIPASLSQYIHFHENISQSELYNFYQNAEVFVFPSKAEGFGIPPLEAGLLGCKVISSKLTAMEDFDFFPYSYDPKKENLEKYLSDILEDENYPHTTIKNQILNKYNWETIASDFLKVLKNSPS